MPNGWLVSLAILGPNLLWLFLPPRDAPGPFPRKSPRWVGALEAIGRLGVLAVPCFLRAVPCFLRMEIAGPREWVGVGVMGLALVVYYGGWSRYFLMGRRYELLYRSLFKLPIPLAVSPVVFFIAASVVLDSAALAVMALVFGGPHIYLSYRESGYYKAPYGCTKALET